MACDHHVRKPCDFWDGQWWTSPNPQHQEADEGDVQRPIQRVGLGVAMVADLWKEQERQSKGESWDENLDDIGLVVWTKSKKTRFAKEIVNWDQAWKTKEWAIPLTSLGSNFEALELGSGGNLTVCELENHHISIGKSTRNGHAFTSKALNCQRVYYNTSVKSHPKSKTHSLKTIGRIKAESKEISIVAIGP